MKMNRVVPQTKRRNYLELSQTLFVGMLISILFSSVVVVVDKNILTHTLAP